MYLDKPDLMILSDLYGFENQGWYGHYIQALEPYFDIALMDIKLLAQIKDTDPQDIHRRLINGGVQKVVATLRSYLAPDYILAFSMGGYIAWEYANQINFSKNMVLVSATRIRKSNQRPKANVVLYYGQQDRYKPSDYWLDAQHANPMLIQNEGHDFYRKEQYASIICTEILDSYLTLHSNDQ